MNKGLLEILKTRLWMVSPDFAHNTRIILEANLATHSAFKSEEKQPGYIVGKDAQPIIKEYQVTENGKTHSRWKMDEMDAPFVNVLNVDGPITRYGGACSYGSAEHRDWMIEAASNQFCVGHVFYIDTPGGSAWAKNDYQQAIDYAHKKGQKVLAFIDGTCASAGMYLASLCDEVYYMHPKDSIGCIGVMAAFYTEKSGEKNQYTNETYHELYDPESFDKNKWARDIANDNDSKLLLKELAELGVEFRKDVKKAFPRATDEHLHGKVFDCGKVKGILCDGQATFSEVIARAFALSEGSATPVVREVTSNGSNAGSMTNQNPSINMKKYETLAAACGKEKFEIDEQGAIVLDNADCDAMAKTLDANKEALDKANEQVKEMQGKLDAAEKAQADAATAAETAKEDAVKAAKADAEKAAQDAAAKVAEEHKKEMDALQAKLDQTVADNKKAMDEVQDKLDKANTDLAAANQSINDKDAQIKALTNKPAEENGGSPASNGTGAPESGTVVNAMPAYDDSKSPLENKKIREAWLKEHNK